MESFALVLCSVKVAETSTLKRVWRYLISWLKALLMKPDLKQWICKVVLYEKLEVYVIKLPYSREELLGLSPRRLGKISGYITRLLIEKSIQTCIYSKSLSEILPRSEQVRNDFTGRTLYKALVLNMIDEIYTKKNIDTSKLDAAIIHGTSLEELNIFIELLSKKIKYITVLTCEKEKLQSELERIFEDTGLAIRLTSDYRSSLKNADLVINMEGSYEDVHCANLNLKIVIINYGTADAIKTINALAVINNAEVGLPLYVVNTLGRDICEEFDSLRLAEAILLHRHGLSNALIENRIDYKILYKISSEFSKDDYRIKGFTGRHGIINSIY